MIKVFILSLMANLALTLISFLALPPQVAIHFGLNGMADGWAPSYVHVLVMTTVQLFVFCCIYFVSRLIPFFPPEMVSIPNNEYWLSPVNKPQAIEKINNLLWRAGSAIFMLLLVVNLLMLHANLSKTDKLNLWVFYTVLGAFFCYIIWLLIFSFYRAFRIPDHGGKGV